MYIKIVSKRDNNQDVEENRLFEATNVYYKKMKVASKKAFEDSDIKMPYVLVGSIPEEASFDYIEIKFKEKESNAQSIIVINCSVYLLNQDGKNIDSIHC